MADSSPLDSSTPDSSPPDSSQPVSSPLDSSIPNSSRAKPLTPEEMCAEFVASLPKDLQWPSEPKYPVAIGIRYKKSIDTIRAEKPAWYKAIVDICQLALTHYQESHPEKFYEFESVPDNEEVLVRIVGWIEYTFKFRAKNMMVDGNPVEVFQVTGDKLIGGKLN